MAEQSLKDKTVKGVAWSGLDNVTQMGVSFLVSIILARLLTPDDYGLLGIIAIFTAICSTLINAGFSSALIRKQNCTEEDYNTVFIVNFVLSLLLYFIIFALSPYIAVFFHREELINLTRVSSLGIIIGAVAVVQQTLLIKRIDFKTQTRITIISSLISGFTGVIFALLEFGVWSLVIQQLSAQILRTLLLIKANRWVPNFMFSSKNFHELFGFGWKIMISGLLDTVWRELYQVVVGKYYSPATLGQYTRSKHFSQLFSVNLTNVIQRVTYPVLSNIQEDKERMISAYRRIIRVSMFVTAISMLFLGAISEPLLYCLIGPKWSDAALYLPLICLSSSSYPLHAINLNMLQIQGRSDLFLGLEIIKKIIALCPLYVGAFIGIIPMLYVNLVTTMIAYFLNSYYSGKFLGYSSWMQIKDFAPSYGVALLIALSVYFFKYLPISYWLTLPLQLIIGIIVFFIITHNMDEYKEMKGIITPFLKKCFKKQ